MKRNIIISVVVVWILLVGVVWLWPATDDTKTPTQSTTSEPSRPTTGTADTITITTTGAPVVIPDVRKQAVKDFDYGVILFYGDERVSMLYYGQSDSFLVSLDQVTNLPSDRQAAEAIFLQELGISRAEACRLTIDVVVPEYVNYSLAGSYPLSFCNDGV